MADVKVTIRPTGPVRIECNEAEVVLEDGSVVTKQIKFSICRCGHSKRMPFCDGEHKFAEAVAMPLVYEPARPNKDQ